MYVLVVAYIFTPGLVRVHTIKYSLYTRGSIWNSVIAKEKEFFCFAQRDLKVVYWPPCKIGTATFWSPCKINRVFPAECRHRISLAATNNIWQRPAYIYCCKSFIDCSRAFSQYLHYLQITDDHVKLLKKDGFFTLLVKILM